jgi:hypothetical protein
VHPQNAFTPATTVYSVAHGTMIFNARCHEGFSTGNDNRKLIHVHVVSPDGEAKFWLEPTVALADYVSLNKLQLLRLQRIVEKRKNEIISAWQKHFS